MCRHSRDCHKPKCKPKCCKPGTAITLKCNKTYVISKPGNYLLIDNTRFNPNELTEAAIIVDASNVVIDLCGKRLYQTNQVLTTGIKVRPNRDCVTIKNGTIDGFQGWSIHYEGPNSDIKLLDLLVKNSGTNERDETANAVDGGIKLGDQPNEVRVSDVTIQNVHVSDVKNFGILVALVKNAKVDNVVVENISADAPIRFISGLNFRPYLTANDRASNLSISNSVIRHLKSDQLTGIFALGASLLGFSATDNVTLTNTKAVDIEVSGLPNQLPIFSCNWLGGGNKNMVVENCEFTGNKSTGVALSACFHHSGDSFGNGLRENGNDTIRDCTFGNLEGDQFVYGFEHVFHDQVDVLNCHVTDVRSRGVNVGAFAGLAFTPEAVGILIRGGRPAPSTDPVEDNIRANPSNVVMRSSTVQKVVNEKGWAAGFAHAPLVFNKFVSSEPDAPLAPPVIVENIQYSDCVAQSITSNGDFEGLKNVPGVAFGYLLDRGVFKNNLFEIIGTPNIQGKYADEYKNVVVKNSSASGVKGVSGGAGVGFYACDNGVVCDCVFDDCYQGVLLSGGDALFPIPPDAVTPLGFSKHALVQGNKTTNSASYGYEDVTVPSQSVFVQNTGFQNGVGGAENFQVTPAANLINNVSFSV